MPLALGLVGYGSISDIYVTKAKLFRDFAMAAGADRRPDAACAKAQRCCLRSMSFDGPNRRERFDLLVDLAVLAAHTEVSLAPIATGKHAYREKPLAISVADSIAILGAAAIAANVRIGSIMLKNGRASSRTRRCAASCP